MSKKLTTVLTSVLVTAVVFAQSPEKMSYQAVIRNASNTLVINHTVGMQISILQGSASSTAVYTEIQTPVTNANGLISIEIGGGTFVSGSFAAIQWSNGPYFIKTETDPTGGTNYTITGTSQLLSVPYALHANTAETLTGAINETDPVYGASIAKSITATDTTRWNHKLDAESQNLSDVIKVNNAANGQIKNVTDPTDARDAATKAYVDALKDIIYKEMMDAGLNGLVKDADGNLYKTVKIGQQVWMAENLRTSRYNNGTTIPLVTDNTAWGNLTTGGYCWYGNDSATYAPIYGALYNGYTIETGNLCPTGWHIPTDDDWETLNVYLGVTSGPGGQIKETGTKHWLSPNTGATNETGFTARPGGCRDQYGTFDLIGSYGFWWSSTAYSDISVWYHFLHYYYSSIFRNHSAQVFGYSVRCLRD